MPDFTARTMNGSPEKEAARIDRLEWSGALHPFTIRHLRGSIHERLMHPMYQHPAQSSDRAAIRNGRFRGYESVVRRAVKDIDARIADTVAA